LRIDFGERLSPEQMRSVLWLLEHQHPEAIVRQAASGRGLVITSRSIDRPLEDPSSWPPFWISRSPTCPNRRHRIGRSWCVSRISEQWC
jgi:hypothetical protein